MAPYPRFVADVMLGRLARWLRLAGLDTAYRADWGDDELIRHALVERRILLTRDRHLYERARRFEVPVLFVEHDDYTEQFREVCRHFALEPDALPWFARCADCNALIEQVSRRSVRYLVPEYVWRRHRRFYRCPQCGKVFWAGSHYTRIQRMRQALRKPEGRA